MTLTKNEGIFIRKESLSMKSNEQIWVQVMVTFNAIPLKIEAFVAILQNAKRQLPQVAGCERVDIYRGVDVPHLFTLLETWTSREAHLAHLEELTITGNWSHIASHLSSEPVSQYIAALE